VSSSRPRGPLAKLVAEAAAPLDGMLSLRLEDGPPWLSLAADPAGAAPVPTAPVRAGEPARIEAYLSAAAGMDALRDLSAAGLGFKVRAELSGGPEGSAETAGRILLVPGEASLRLTGHTQDPAGATPLVVTPRTLQDATEALDLLLVDALADAGAGALSVSADTWLVTFEPRAAGERIALIPAVASWCACFALLDRGSHKLRIEWTGPDALQRAVAATTVVVATPWRELAWPCAKLFLVIVGALYLGWCSAAYLRARQFPRRSGVSVYFGPREDSLFRPLHRWNGRFLKSLIAPFAGVPHEVRTVEGLTLRAASNGADILMDKSDANFRIGTLNQTIDECRAENARMATYKMNWNDSVERRDGGLRRLTLLSKPEDQGA
jgi:hypothetical protein